MSFFGLRTVVNKTAPKAEYDFEADDLDDRLGRQLQESGDDLNNETFGDSKIGSDFDFAGSTAGFPGIGSGARASPGYGQPLNANSTGNVPPLQPIASLWNTTPAAPSSSLNATNKPKVLSVEELEAQMIGGNGSPANRGPYPPPPPNSGMVPPNGQAYGAGYMPFWPPPPVPYGQPPVNMPYDQQYMPQVQPQVPQVQQIQPQVQAQPQTQVQPEVKVQSQPKAEPPVPSQPQAKETQVPYKPAKPAEVLSLDQLMIEEAQKSVQEDRELLQRSRHKAQNVEYNGLMRQWDKNFIMRIQLKQMVTEDPYNEDFYYQVHSAIQQRGNDAQKQHEINEFAQTYFKGRNQRNGNSRNRQNNMNPLQRMQQQVQEAVQMAKDHPKREHIALEGALGRVSIGGGKRPRKALNIKKLTLTDKGNALLAEAEENSDASAVFTTKRLLENLEDIFALLLELESVERSGEDNPDLTENLWKKLGVMSPVSDDGKQPFISILSHDKGKKLIPRVFRHLDQRKKLTLLTRIIAQIDSLDVIVAEPTPQQLESISLFSQTVLPPLVHLISDASYDVVVGLLEILLNGSNNFTSTVIKSKVGLTLLTVMISRAELLSQEPAADGSDDMLENWQKTFQTLFDTVQKHLGSIFPPAKQDESYVWHFLASMALAAKLEHQRIIVDEVRDKIFATMADCKTLPPELSTPKMASLNLFLNVMGLTATPTQISELKTE